MDKNTVCILQKKQAEHDQLYHQDVLYLGTKDRLKHLVLHFIKYAANLENYNSFTTLQKNIVDSSICVLSMANALNIDLDLMTNGRSNDSLIKIIGKMAKACEALDHVEAFPSYEVLTIELKNLYLYMLNAARDYNLDLNILIASRWNEIADKSIFKNKTLLKGKK